MIGQSFSSEQIFYRKKFFFFLIVFFVKVSTLMRCKVRNRLWLSHVQNRTIVIRATSSSNSVNMMMGMVMTAVLIMIMVMIMKIKTSESWHYIELEMFFLTSIPFKFIPFPSLHQSHNGVGDRCSNVRAHYYRDGRLHFQHYNAHIIHTQRDRHTHI